MAIPGELVHPSSESSWGSAVQSKNTSVKENPEHRQVVHLLGRPGAPLLRTGQATTLVAQRAGMVGILLGPPEMLQKSVLEKPNTTLGELENSGLLHWRAQKS